MKLTTLLALFLCLWVHVYAQQDFSSPEIRIWNQVSVGKEAANPSTHPGAWLEIGTEGTRRGFLLPRTDTGNIIAAARGLLIYSLKDKVPIFFNGSFWDQLQTTRNNTGVRQLLFNPTTGVLKILRNGPSDIQVQLGTHDDFTDVSFDTVQRKLVFVRNNGQLVNIFLPITVDTSGGSGTYENPLTFSPPFIRSINTVGMQVASSVLSGYLLNTDWQTFNAKVPPTRTISTLGALKGGGALSGNLTLTVDTSSSTKTGVLLNTDWAIFNAKQNAITWQNFTSANNKIGVTGGSAAVNSAIVITLNEANVDKNALGGGALTIANGGTGATNKYQALLNLLDTAGHAGHALQYDGDSVYLAPISGDGGVSDPGSNGLMARTALNTTVARQIAGTTDVIEVTNPDGVSGNPTINIGVDVVTRSATQNLSNKKLLSPKIEVGSDKKGDMYYNDGTGALVRVPFTAAGHVLTMNADSTISGQSPGGGGGNHSTVAALAANSSPSLTVPYIITDYGQQGVYFYDSTDVTSESNGGTTMGKLNAGTIIKTASNHRFKRVYDGVLDIRWFGGISNYVYTSGNYGTGYNNDTALLHMDAVAVSGQKQYIPKVGTGFLFLTTTPIPWDNSKARYLHIDGTTYHNGTSFLKISNSTTTIHTLRQTGRAQAIFGIGAHTSNVVGAGSYDYATLTGTFVEVYDSRLQDIQLNEVHGFGEAVKLTGETDLTQENTIRFNSLLDNRVAIKLLSVDGASNVDKNTFIGGTISGDTAIVMDGHVLGTGDFQGNFFSNIYFTRVNAGILLWRGDIRYTKFSQCAISGNPSTSIYGTKILLNSTGGTNKVAYGTNFTQMDWLDLGYFSDIGSNTTLNGTALFMPNAYGSQMLGSTIIGGRTGRATIVGSEVLTTNTRNNLVANLPWIDHIALTNTGNPKVEFANDLKAGVANTVSYDGKFRYVSDTSAATVTLPVPIGHIKANRTTAITLIIDAEDLRSGKTILFEKINTGTVEIRRSSDNTVFMATTVLGANTGVWLLHYDQVANSILADKFGGTTSPTSPLNLTTNFTTGPSTYDALSNTLNIPVYTSGSGTATPNGYINILDYGAKLNSIADTLNNHNAVEAAKAAAKEGDIVYCPGGGTLYISRTITMVVTSVTSKRYRMMFNCKVKQTNKNVDAFLMQGDWRQELIVYNLEGGNTVTTDTSVYNTYTGSGIKVINSYNSHVVVGEIRLFRIGIDVTGATGNGSQYVLIEGTHGGGAKLWQNYEQVRLSRSDGGVWNNEITLRNMQLGSGTTNDGRNGVYGLVLISLGASPQASNLESIDGWDVNYEGLYYGVWANYASSFNCYNCRMEEGAVKVHFTLPLNGVANTTFTGAGPYLMDYFSDGKGGRLFHLTSGNLWASVAIRQPSTTSNTIGTGLKTFTIPTGLTTYSVGAKVKAIADTANVMFGTVSSYNSTTGQAVLDITSVKGSGTFASWNLQAVFGSGQVGDELYTLKNTPTLTGLNNQDGKVYVKGVMHPGATAMNSLYMRDNLMMRFELSDRPLANDGLFYVDGEVRYGAYSQRLTTITTQTSVTLPPMVGNGWIDFNPSVGNVTAIVNAGDLTTLDFFHIKVHVKTIAFTLTLVNKAGTILHAPSFPATGKYEITYVNGSWTTSRYDGGGAPGGTNVTFAVAGSTPNIYGASVDGSNQITLQPAQNNNPGIVVPVDQTWDGNKTFLKDVTVSNAAGTSLIQAINTGSQTGRFKASNGTNSAELFATASNSELWLGRTGTSGGTNTVLLNSGVRQWTVGMQLGASDYILRNDPANAQRLRVFANGNTLLGAQTSDQGFKLFVDGTGKFTNTLTLAVGTTSIAPLNIPVGTGFKPIGTSGDIQNNGSYLLYTNDAGFTDNLVTMTNTGVLSGKIWDGAAISFLKGGTGLTALGTAGQSIRVKTDLSGFEWYTPTASGTTETASNGLTKVGTDIQLGGTLNATVSINGQGTRDFNMGTSGSRVNNFNIYGSANFMGSVKFNQTVISNVSFTIGPSDNYLYLSNTLTATRTLTMPAHSAGKVILIQNNSTNGSFAYQLNTTYVLASNMSSLPTSSLLASDFYIFMSDGTQWIALNK